MSVPHFDGWTLIGALPGGEPDDVGNWPLAHGGGVLFLEIPYGLTASKGNA